MPKTIVSSGYNGALLRVRNAVMEMAGYVVVTSKESGVIVDLLAKQDFDGAVICSSIPIQLRVELARSIKKAKPALPLIVLYSDGESDRLQGLADELVQSVHGFAQPLIEAITRLVGEPD
jgi:DNA-binding response OmpR family regulator